MVVLGGVDSRCLGIQDIRKMASMRHLMNVMQEQVFKETLRMKFSQTTCAFFFKPLAKAPNLSLQNRTSEQKTKQESR